ncbi:hypothetical protein QS369_25795, partial [Escherichia coli]|nr:hypothetical protein [Escherichia coli]
QNDVTLKMPAFEWVHVQLHQQKGMISLSPPTICNSAACVGLAFDPAQRIALWCGLPFVALCYGAYFLTQPRNAKQEPEHVAE